MAEPTAGLARWAAAVTGDGSAAGLAISLTRSRRPRPCCSPEHPGSGPLHPHLAVLQLKGHGLPRCSAAIGAAAGMAAAHDDGAAAIATGQPLPAARRRAELTVVPKPFGVREPAGGPAVGQGQRGLVWPEGHSEPHEQGGKSLLLHRDSNWQAPSLTWIQRPGLTSDQARRRPEATSCHLGSAGQSPARRLRPDHDGQPPLLNASVAHHCRP